MIDARTRAERYAQAALDRQCAEVASIAVERNSALNRAAFGLGQLVGAGYLDRANVEAELYAAATANGYIAKDGTTAARATIRSGLSRGALFPRDIPDRRWCFGTAYIQVDPAEISRRHEMRRRAEAAERADTMRRQKIALAIWEAARDPRGSLAEHYLRSRGLDLPEDIAGRALRFEPRGRWEGDFAPMTIALMRDPLTGEPRGVHRTALTADGRKIGRKMLGPAGAVMFDAEDTITTGLTIGEGVETVLAARQLGLRPAWAVCSTSGIAGFPVLPGVETLTLLVENDANGASERACREAGTRWHAAGWAVDLVAPRVGKDMNDAIREGATCR